MKFLTVSVKLLQYIALEVKTEASMNNTLEHVVLGIVAVLCLLVFVVPPMVVLLFYHLKIFQRCLTWCKLDRPGLHALVNAYQGCFKNSATDGVERRYFAGIYLLFRFCYLLFIFFFTFFSNFHSFDINNLPLAIYEACVSFIMAGVIVMMQPYKKKIHNVTNFAIYFWMSMIAIPSLSPFISVYTNPLIFLPLLVVFFFFAYCVMKYCFSSCTVTCKHTRAEYGSNKEATPLSPKPPTKSEVILGDLSSTYK